jgi:hypothetical protein
MAQMTDDQHLRRKFREEADDSLFLEIRFDERLKESIRARVQAEDDRMRKGVRSPVKTLVTTESRQDGTWAARIGTPESGAADAPRSDRRKSLHRRWAYGLGTVASLVIVAALTFTPWMDGDDTGGAMTAQPGEMMIGSGAESAAAAQEAGDPLSATESGAFEVMSGAATGPSADPDGETAVQVLSGPEEAAAWFGEPLPLPSYVPEGYRLERVSAAHEAAQESMSGTGQQIEPTEALADAMHILYVSDNGDSYELTIRRPGHGQATGGTWSGEKVELDGATGYWQPGSGSLRWMMGHLEYQLTGSLDRDEMIRVAASVDR